MDPRENLKAYLDGELTTEARLSLEAQIAASPAMQRELDELRSISAAIKRLDAAPILGLEETLRAVQQRRPRSLILVWGLSAAACLSLLTVAFSLSRRSVPHVYPTFASYQPASASVAGEQSAPQAAAKREMIATDSKSEKVVAIPTVELTLAVSDPTASPDAAWNMIAGTSAKRRMEEEKPRQLVVDVPSAELQSIQTTLSELSPERVRAKSLTAPPGSATYRLRVTFERPDSESR